MTRAEGLRRVEHRLISLTDWERSGNVKLQRRVRHLSATVAGMDADHLAVEHLKMLSQCSPSHHIINNMKKNF